MIVGADSMGNVLGDWLVKNHTSASGGEDNETDNKRTKTKCHDAIIAHKF